MTIKQLEYFMEVARQLNFSSAARSLYISQPALSRSISALEEELGVILLFRDRHNVALTPAGIVLATAMPKLKSELERLVVLVQQAREGMSGKLVLGFQSGLRIPQALSDALGYLHRSLPFIEVTPFCSESRELVSELAYGNVDIIFICDGLTPDADGVSSLLMDTVPMCYAYMPDEGGRSFLPSEQTYIFTGSESSRHVDRWRIYCRSHGFYPKLMFAKDSQTQSFLIENRYGVGVFPETHKIFESGEVVKQQVGGDYTASEELFWNSANLNSSVDVFIKLIRGDI